MLKLRIITVGRNKDRWLETGCEHYRKLLSRFARIEVESVEEARYPIFNCIDDALESEGERLRKLVAADFVIALSDRGRQFDSPGFAGWIQERMNASISSIDFLVGGPYGLARSVLDSAAFTLSLSPMTYTHQLVRLVLLEQLYRAMSILHNTGYHK